MQKLLVFQSLWAMVRAHSDGVERTLDQNIELIGNAGFDGVSTFLTDPRQCRRTADLLQAAGLQAEGICFPRTVDELQPALEMAAEMGVHHLNVHAKPRPHSVAEAIPFIEGWQRLAEQVEFPVYFETHRDCITTDLFVTLDLLDHFPNMMLVGDLSHFLVGQEFPFPLTDANQRHIERILDRCGAFHGRVGSSQQIQVEISLPQHSVWLELFSQWWSQGFSRWKRRAGQDQTLAFTCELGPKPYAISGLDGNDLTDRWVESQMMQKLVRKLWDGLPE